MKKYVHYYEMPGRDQAVLRFGVLDKEFPRLVAEVIPDEWMTSELKVSSLTGQSFINLRHHEGIFEELIELIEGIEDHGEVKINYRKYPDSPILKSYLIN